MRRLRVRVAPRVPAGQAGGGIEPGRLLPLGLGGQPAPGPAGVRVGLIPAHVQHRLVRRDRLLPAEHPAGPLPALAPPVQRRGQPGLLPVLPARPGPPARVVVPAILDELGIGAAGHRGGVEVERRHLHGVRRALVVQRPGLGGGPHGERAAGHEDLGREPERVGWCRVRRPGGEHRHPGPDLVGDQHRLVVLHLVLRDHPEREPVAEQPRPGEPGPVEQVENPAAHLVAVGPGLGGRQQRQRGTLRARVLERVIERIDLRVYRLAAADLAQQPELFGVGDVREVPDQRGHQRRVLSDQVGLVHAVGQQRGPLAGAGQFPRDDLAQVFRVELRLRHRQTPSSWSSAGHRSFCT